MGRSLIVIAALSIFLAAYFYLHETPHREDKESRFYPWQVTEPGGGETEVFGIVLNRTTARQAMLLLGREPEIVLYEHNGHFSLEAYFGKIGGEGITGKLIAVLAAPAGWSERSAEHAIKTERVIEGGTKGILRSDAYRMALVFPVISLTYIPSIRLDRAIVENRFGPPETIKTSDDGRSHFGYESRGVIISLDPSGKSIISYMPLKDYRPAMERLQKEERTNDG
ncbi:hypothetical protein MNBD_NITROSPINAE04-2672 [hydrothermal vent metagenome]|uniref:Uncharacterized protein n=1 Tax=hydrothermal vent metagenome TaxID=652676 RepID=A0A3B1C6L4_9ZZZZ